MVKEIKKVLNFITDYLEEGLIILGFIFLAIFGFLINVKIGFITLSIDMFLASFYVKWYKKMLNR